MGWSSLNPFSDDRDDDAANKALGINTTQNTQAYDGYNVANQANLAQNSTIAGTDYYGNAAQVYGQQQTAAGMLQQQANGTAPSAAQIQMGLGLSQANQQAQSAALSQQGGVLSGNTQRNMLNAQAGNSQNVLGQTAQLRAQEQLSGQQQYASTLNAMQGQQQQQGSLKYGQAETGLQNSMTLNQQNLGNAQNTAQLLYGNTTGNINQQQQATQAGMKNGFGTVAALGSAVATGGASLGVQAAGSAASNMLGSNGSSRTWGTDPNTGYLKGY